MVTADLNPDKERADMVGDSILIIDDHALFRSGIVALLATVFQEIRIFDSASLEEALEEVEFAPAVVLLDIQLPGTGGLEGIDLIKRRWPEARIVVVSAHDLPITVDAALARGATAFLSKVDRPERMMSVLRESLERSPLGTSIRGAVGPRLTPRQTEVVALVERGLSNKVIGRQLGLSEHTVRGHVQAVLSALGAIGRAEAAFKARQLGLIG